MTVPNVTNIQPFIKAGSVPPYFRLKKSQGFRSTPNISTHTIKKLRVGLFTRGLAQPNLSSEVRLKVGCQGGQHTLTAVTTIRKNNYEHANATKIKTRRFLGCKKSPKLRINVLRSTSGTNTDSENATHNRQIPQYYVNITEHRCPCLM
jgi:hypothetical protein